MIGIYFSGTGNTRHCVEEFMTHFDRSGVYSIEDENITKTIEEHNTLVFGYPIHFSNAPKIVRDFVLRNKDCFQGKKIFIIATMGLFSGDGAGCTARMFRKCNAKIIGGLHLKMPDCIGDEKLLKKTLEENKEIVKNANAKINVAAKKFKQGKPTKEGLNFLNHAAGLFGQRLWFYGKTLSYKKKPNIDSLKCIGCGHCVQLCPMNNLEIVEDKAVSKNKCTMCYRCVGNCPTKSLTILGKQVYEQCLFEKYK